MTRPRAGVPLAIPFAVLLVTGGLVIAQSAFVSIGLTEAAAKRLLLGELAGDSHAHPSPMPEAATRKFRALSPTARRQVAVNLWAWAKSYVASTEFRTEYARLRAANRPTSVQYDRPAVEDELKARQQEELARLEEGVKLIGMLPAAERATIEAQYKQSKAFFQSPEYLAAERAKIEEERGKNRSDDTRSVARWNEMYPEDPRVAVARHLATLLETTQDVDWNARIMDYGGEPVFAKFDDYLKPWPWREAFWAGRDVLDVSRDQAAAWLTELGHPPGPELLARRDVALVGVKPAAARTAPAAVAIGVMHGVLLTPEGTLRSWTYASVNPNRHGEFGLGHTSPMPIYTLAAVPNLSGVVKVSAGEDCTFAILADGTLLGWGSNLNGQLGTTRPDQLDTDLLPGPDRPSPTPPVVAFPAIDVSASAAHVLAVARDGGVYAWGAGEYGQLGIGDMPMVRIRNGQMKALRDAVPYPVRVPGIGNATAVAAGRDHSLALLADGTVRAWGRNKLGQLGDGTTTDRTTPVVVTNVTGAVAVAAGADISAALLADGTVMVWGSKEYSAMGRPGPPATPVPFRVPGVGGITAISAGDGHFVALTSAGTVFSWGADQIGETGKNRVNSGVPTAIPRLANVKAVYAKFRRTIAVLADGSIRTWGNVPLFGRPTGDKNVSPIPIELVLEGLGR
jgi:alpha-tubulin suppressor-like RCC1 family protein